MAVRLASQTWLPLFMQYIQVKNQGNWIQVATLNSQPLCWEAGSL